MLITYKIQDTQDTRFYWSKCKQMYIPYQHLQKTKRVHGKEMKTCEKLYNSDKVQKRVSSVKRTRKIRIDKTFKRKKKTEKHWLNLILHQCCINVNH